MRRAIRIFFHLVAGLMFLLGACVLVLWVRSYWGQDTGIATRRLAPGSLPSERRPDAQVFGLISVAGGLGFIYGSHDPAISLMQTDWQYEQ
ncbi:MAG TPA: hypothetical protein VEA69_10140 [Tepidisphaeraceae bacterium]|nr:hypothetical protein [Tepidisphaeraceae bacterium]